MSNKTEPSETKAKSAVAEKKEKYPVNILFDRGMEPVIKARAGELGIGVATYIKMLVYKDLSKSN